jgi:NADP-dependent 3-hydroxy acid dehydrogenase YdfG
MQTLSTNDWKWCLDVNLWGVIHGLRVFLAGLIEQDEGHVVITSSVAGLTSYPGSGPYNASKHAVASVAETLFAELAESGSQVGVSCLCPGLVATRILESDRNRPKELTDEHDDAPGFDPAVRDAVASVFASAKPPAEVAELVLAAIVERRFWIETDPVFREAIRARHRAIETGGDPPARGSVLTPYVS